MILFVTALFNADGTFAECLAGSVPIAAEGAGMGGRTPSSCGMVQLKPGINPHDIRHHVEPDGAGGARFKDSINDIALLCCRRTPATVEGITAGLEAEGQNCMHLVARTWLAEKLPAEYDDYFGEKLQSHPRAVELVKTMIHKAAQRQPTFTNFKKHLRIEARINEPTKSDKK